MPTYTISTSHGEFEIDANREPTPDEAAQAIAQQLAQTTPAQSAAAAGLIPQKPTMPDNRPDYMRSGGGVNTIANMGIEAAGPMIGQAAGMATGPFAEVGVPVLGAAGGAISNAIAQGRRISAGDQPNFSWGQVLGAGIAGAVPGGTLAGASVKQVAKEGAKYAAANLAAKTAETLTDTGQLPSGSQALSSVAGGALGAMVGRGVDAGAASAAAAGKMSRNAARDAILAEGQKVGFVIPPTRINPNFANKELESFAGKADLNQLAVLKNQETANALARQAIGVSPDAALTGTLLKAVRDASGAPYAAVDNIAQQAKDTLAGFQAATRDMNAHEAESFLSDPSRAPIYEAAKVQAFADVDGLKAARNEARNAFTQFAIDRDPRTWQAAQDWSEKANLLDKQIDAAAISAGQPDLVAQLDAARKRIAKSYNIESALNADGNIDPAILGRMWDKAPNAITGELATIGKFQQAFPQAMKLASNTPTSGVSKLKATLQGGALIGGSAAGHPILGGMVAAAVPMGENLTRSALLSRYLQNFAASPYYNRIGTPDNEATIMRYMAQNYGRNP